VPLFSQGCHGIEGSEGSEGIAMVEHHQMLRDDWIKSQFWSVDYELLSWPPTVFEALVQSGLMHAETSRKDIQLFKAAYEKQHQVPARSDSVKYDARVTDIDLRIEDCPILQVAAMLKLGYFLIEGALEYDAERKGEDALQSETLSHQSQRWTNER
jgi:hypothetical protein